MTTAAIILAAGRGTRAGEGVPKQWRLLAGKQVLEHTITTFSALVSHIVVVAHPEDIEIAASYGLPVVLGGAARADSVRHGLEYLATLGGISEVLIHDGARPLTSAALIKRVLEALKTHTGAAPAVALSDALWRGEARQSPPGANQSAHQKISVTETVPRDGLWRAQTPQGFHFDAILSAHRALEHAGGTEHAADDVDVARRAGINVAIVEGDEENLKLTFPNDFARAEAILRRQQKEQTMDIRVGNGFDVHACCPGDHMWLCGVRLAHDCALLGHSDADVGMHALTDAIYGALAEGDIGQHFPPSDPQWKGAESKIFLAHAMGRVAARGYRLANCDVTLICERPKIGRHQGAMRAALATVMGVDVACISVKATTSERLGFTGREEGIAALATATLIAAGVS